MKLSDHTLLAKCTRALPYLIILIGILARLSVFIDNRSFFIDEANLARNVVERSAPDFFESLAYEQYAPPLFLLETKLVTKVLGVRDYSFRVIPFICGIGCILLIWLLLREWNEDHASKIYTLGLWCFSVLAIRYGTEFKQYSSDAFLCLLLIWLAWKDRQLVWDWGRVVYWMVLGVVFIWYSMPVVFILGGVGMFFLHVAQRQEYPRIVGLGMSWALSFGVYYYCLLSKDVFDSNLQAYHSDYFLELFSLSSDTWSKNGHLLALLFKSLTAKTLVPVVFGMGAFTVGTYRIYKEDKSKFLLLFIPLMALVFASSLGLYSFIPRMTLFILPIMLLVMASGISHLWMSRMPAVRYIMLALILLSLVSKEGYSHIYESMETEDIKTVLHYAANKIKPEEQVFIHHDAVPSYVYYSEQSRAPINVPGRVYLADWKTTPVSYLSQQPEINRIWILLSHVTVAQENELLAALRIKYEVQTLSDQKNASLHLVKTKD